ncbi:restriction endonuclease [Embleya sp. NPDC005575]|uniref:restriction endonuclease n=1 Tax=Embleya sp. NPDC005575 TaxID=3156892 RepID=UPI0033A106C8
MESIEADGSIEGPATSTAIAGLADEQRLDRQRSLTSVDAMSGTGFEDHVAALCRRDGCTEVARVGGGGDLGADVVGRLPDGRRLVIQCRRYATHRPVGSGDVQRFNGTARAEHGADVPVIVTATVFTAPARDFAARHALILIDRDLLGFWQNGTPLTAFLVRPAVDADRPVLQGRDQVPVPVPVSRMPTRAAKRPP